MSRCSSYYRDIVKPGVQFRQELVVSIDPVARRVVTDRSTYDADVLVVALGAEYDFSVPPGFEEGGHEFYSIDGALKLRDVLPSLTSGKVIIARARRAVQVPAGALRSGHAAGRVPHGARRAVRTSRSAS